MTAIQRWLLALLATGLAVTGAYLWLDRPIALLVHRLFPHHETFERLTHIPDPFVPAAVIVFVGVGLCVLSGRALTRIKTAALLCSLSLTSAEATKNFLKYVFGRFWPDTWIQNNPSFIRDGAYGFHPFHGGPAYASFPSGHTAITFAVVSVLWILYPRFRPLYALAALAVVIGLIGANYHFFSDVIGGAFVGTSTGWMMVALWQRRQGDVFGPPLTGDLR